MEQNLSLFFGLSFLTAALAFAYAAYLYLWVKKQPVRNATIADVSALIKEGANTFMRRGISDSGKICRHYRRHHFHSASLPHLAGKYLKEPVHGSGLSVWNCLFRHRRQDRHYGGHPLQLPGRGGRQRGH